MKKIIFSLLALSLVCLPSFVLAQNFPSKSVNYVIPFGPGGESDITARFQQPYFKKLFGEELIVSYKPGGGGAVGWSQLNNMADDGSVIMGINLPHIIIKPRQGNVGFITSDITSVYIFHYTPDALVVRANSSFKTLADFILYAKSNPRKLTLSGSGKGTANHLAQVIFDQISGIKTTYVSFKGTGASTTANLGEQVVAQWGYSTVKAAQGNSVRMLAVAMEKRHPAFPDVPTFRELGYDMVSGAYRGIAVPKSASEATRKAVSDAIAKINQDKDFQKKMLEGGFALIDVAYGSEMDEFVAEKSRLYLSAARSAGLIK